MAAIRKRWPWRKHLFADGAYDRTRLMDAAAYRHFVLEIVRRTDKGPGFNVLPRRWVVERTFGWITRWKRLVREYEQRLDVSHVMIQVALSSRMLRRIVHPRIFSNRLLESNARKICCKNDTMSGAAVANQSGSPPPTPATSSRFINPHPGAKRRLQPFQPLDRRGVGEQRYRAVACPQRLGIGAHATPNGTTWLVETCPIAQRPR
ncbi:transposase [Sphingomonas trueperi]|uniref:Transposase n=1 Tax=Sphingomonas trueperi TaxID=53317 RepID=A0A7X5XZH0_9SPHN|nr:transposase [Sphingomonas trueperi]